MRSASQFAIPGDPDFDAAFVGRHRFGERANCATDHVGGVRSQMRGGACGDVSRSAQRPMKDRQIIGLTGFRRLGPSERVLAILVF